LGKLRLDADTGVNDNGAVGAGDDRAEVKFGDFRQVVGEPGDPQQRVAQRRAPGRRTAGGRAQVALRPRPGLDRVEQHVGVDAGQRR
jgi:hypothetical protein